MTKKYEVGDRLRYVGVHGRYFTNGEIYEVTGEDMYSVYVNNDHGMGYGLSGSYLRDNFELVTSNAEPTPVEASPTVIELLANISRRLYEAEQTIKEQAYEINELYKEVADRG